MHNLPVSNALSNTFIHATNSCSARNHGHTMPEHNAQPNMMQSVSSDVITAQVGAKRISLNSPSLQMNPISLNFTFETIQNNNSDYYYLCAYWNFSDP